MSATLPDPLSFVVDALTARGALCEIGADADRATALLPSEEAARLELPEEIRLAEIATDRDEIPIGLGSPLLERLVAEARARCPAAAIRIALEPPRPAHVRSVAERFVLRNGLAEVLDVTQGTARYATGWVSYVVESDDRREGLVRVTASPDGGEPDDAVQEHLDLTWPSADVRAWSAPDALGDAARWIVLRAERAVRAAVEPLLAEVRRRHTRDHERIAEYFAALVAEARSPRRRVEPEAIAAKVAHLVAERDKKLRDLRERFAAKVSVSLAAIAWAELPAALVRVRLRRRKESREIMLYAPSEASRVDHLACEGCGAPTVRPAACDDRVHLLCEACAPNAQGRIACPACSRRMSTTTLTGARPSAETRNPR